MRASVAHGTTASGSSSTALARRLTQKEMELQGVIALREVTTQYIAQLEGMCQDIEVSADAAVGMYHTLSSEACVISVDLAKQLSARFLNSGHRCSALLGCLVRNPCVPESRLQHSIEFFLFLAQSKLSKI